MAKAKAAAKDPVQPAKLIIAGALALVAAYIFASYAIDRGNWAYYGLGFAAIYIGVRYLIKGVVSFKR